MSFHNKPNYQIPELIEALKAHRLPHDTPSQLADSFRIGWMACRELAQADSVPAIQGEMNVQLDTDSNHSAPGQQRDVARSVALGQPMGNGQDQAAGRPSAQGDKLLTVAERNIRSFLRSAQFKCESDREAALNCVDVLWAAARDPADSVPAVERKQERIAFKDAHRHLDLDEVPDAWGRPMFKHSHVEASWLGWIARAVLAKWGQPAHSGEPVAWLNPWRADQVTTDYDAYGEHGIALYTAPQPAPSAAVLDYPHARRFGGCPACGRSDCVAMSCTRTTSDDLLHIAARARLEEKT